MTDHIAAARARLAEHSRCTPVMQEMGAVLDALAIAVASAEAYRVDRDLLQRQVRAQDARIAALRADLVMLKRQTAVPVFGAVNEGVVKTKPQAAALPSGETTS